MNIATVVIHSITELNITSPNNNLTIKFRCSLFETAIYDCDLSQLSFLRFG